MDVVDAIGEGVDELSRIDALPQEVARVEVEAESRVVADRFEGQLAGVEIERDFRRMDLERELHAAFLEDVQDGTPLFGEVVVALLDVVFRNGREGINPVPDRRTCKACHHLDAEALRGPSGPLHLFNGPLPLALGITGKLLGSPRVAAMVVRIEHHLANEVVADGPHVQIVLRQQLPVVLDIILFLQSPCDLEVVSGAGQLETFIS